MCPLGTDKFRTAAESDIVPKATDFSSDGETPPLPQTLHRLALIGRLSTNNLWPRGTTQYKKLA